MAYSFVTYTGNGSTTEYNISFSDAGSTPSKPYLASSHIKVKVAGSIQDPSTYTINEAGTTAKVVFSSAPVNLAAIRIYRETPKTAAGRLVDFQDGAVLTETDLDNSALQNLYIAQEAQDSGDGGIALDSDNSHWDVESKRLTNLAASVNTNDAVTKGEVDAMALYGGATTNPQVWAFTTENATTSTFTLTSPNPTSAINEVFVVYVDGAIQAPSGDAGSPVRDYKITVTGSTYTLVFETGAFPSNTGNTNCPPNGAKVFVQNFGTTRNVFDAPLDLEAVAAADVPLTLTANSGQTADLLRVNNSAGDTQLAKIDKDGDLTVASVTTAGASTTGSLSVTGVSTLTGNVTLSADITASTGDFIATAGDVTANSGSVTAQKIVTTGISGTPAANAVRAVNLVAENALTANTAAVSGHTTSATLATTGDITAGGRFVGPGMLFASCRFVGRTTSGTAWTRGAWKNLNVSGLTYDASADKYTVTFTNARPDGLSQHFAIIQPCFDAGDTVKAYSFYDRYEEANYGDSDERFIRSIRYHGVSSTKLEIFISSDFTSGQEPQDYMLMVF